MRWPRTALLTTWVWVASAGCSGDAGAQSPAGREAHAPAGQVDAAEIDAFVTEAMVELPAVPGLAVTVVSADSVLFEGAWGLRDATRDLPVTTGTGFYIASSTKSFVALLAGLLDHAGTLDLDAPITDCLPGLSFGNTVPAESNSLRDLLRHTRGWENDAVVTRTAYTDFMKPEELRAHLAAHSTVEDDGYFAYDNIGYVVADLCFRERLDTSWKELLDTHVLAPAGLRRTTAYMSEAAGTGDLALPHLWNGRELRIVPPKTDDIMHAAGGLVTTAEDAGRWLRIFLAGGSLDGAPVFPEGVVAEALRRQVDADLSFWEFDRLGYGLGWYDGAYRGERLVHHFGGYTGAQAHLSLMPGRDLGVVALVNGGGAGAYALPHIVAGYVYDLHAGREDALDHAREAVSQAAREAREAAEDRAAAWARLDEQRAHPPAPAHDPAVYVGAYRHPRYGAVAIAHAPAGLLWADWGAREGDLIPLEGDRFLADWEPGQTPDTLVFDVPLDGPAASFEWRGLTFTRERPS